MLGPSRVNGVAKVARSPIFAFPSPPGPRSMRRVSSWDVPPALVGGGQVDRASADHPGDMVLANPDRLTGELARIDPADQLKAEQPFAIVGDKHEPDLVHMGCQHHPQPAGPLSAPRQVTSTLPSASTRTSVAAAAGLPAGRSRALRARLPRRRRPCTASRAGGAGLANRRGPEFERSIAGLIAGLSSRIFWR